VILASGRSVAGLRWLRLTSAFRVDARGRQDPGEVAFATFGTGITMMPEEKLPLADQILDKLDAGVLPRVLPEKMWTGYGCGNPCNGCSQPIYPAQIEYHFPLDSGDVLRLHIGCLGMWLAELRRRGFVSN
jgi:hypothetical protein